MTEILLKSSGFLLVIIVCFCLKEVGLFRKEDGAMLSKLMLNVTMPCALLSAGQNLQLSLSIGIAFLLAIGFNLFLVFGGMLNAKLHKYGRRVQGMFSINSAGFNVGSFAIPFAQMFFPASALPIMCMFDAGNAVMGLGINNAIGASVAAAGTKPTAKSVLKRLLSSPPFDVYLIVLFFAALKLSVPKPILTMVSIAGNANAFVAMAMIGLLLEISLPKQDMKQLVQLLLGRCAMVICMMLFVWFLVPLSPEAKKALILCIATPITSVAVVFTKEMVGESDIPAAANSISIIISLIVMIGVVVLFA